ncbi:MAG: Photosynthesis system assembly factor [Marmoricola sp.]|nr:Photosynthesis system assembly factor [Marmoricola sp.]
MPELPESLQTLARATEIASTPPAFGDLVRRSRQRRRNQVLATAAATAVLVGGVAAMTAFGPQSAPAPSHNLVHRPTPTPKADTPAQKIRSLTAQQMVHQGQLFSFASLGDGTSLRTWQKCTRNLMVCASAWQLVTAKGPSVEQLLSESLAYVYAAGDAYIVRSPDEAGIVVHTDGSVTAIQPVAEARPIGAGDVLVIGKGLLRVVDPDAGVTWPLALPPAVTDVADGQNDETKIDADGRIWLSTFSSSTMPGLTWSVDGGTTWSRHEFGRGRHTGDLVASGQHVATFTNSDGEGGLSFDQWDVSSDAGKSWTEVSPSAVPFAEIASMAATSGGTLYVANVAGKVWRSTDSSWTHFVKVVTDAPVSQLVPAGDHVLGAATDMRGPVLFVRLADDGRATYVDAR